LIFISLHYLPALYPITFHHILILHFHATVGMAQLDARSSGKMGSRALLYYITTTILAAIVGIFMVLVIHPGDPSIKTRVEGGSTDTKVSTLDAILDIIRYVSFICTLICNVCVERRKQIHRTSRASRQHSYFVFGKSQVLIYDGAPTIMT
jgi:hypothetical protein